MATPTPSLGIQNYYSTTLGAPLLATDTIIYINGTLPTPSQGFLVIDLGLSTVEVIFYTSKGANFVQCTSVADGRGQDGTTAQAHGTGASVKMTVTAGYWNALQTGQAFNIGAVGNQAFADGWTPSLETWTYGANNGNKEYTVTISGDKTGKYSPGMKVKLPRVTTPPTQAMSFVAASSQYASKTTPTGITFTAAFTTEAWVYLTAYGASNTAVVSRYDGTNGFILFVNTSGQVQGHYSSGANLTNFQSYQSIPLNRWVHIAVSATIATKVGSIYINGTLAPSSSPSSTATAITQAGNLQVGAYNSTSFFNGYIAEARVWSSAQSQAQIQANMAINLVGNETNLVALFQGNGAFTDATSNANTLTATNGATFTTANPYNATEYGVIVSATYSNPNTTLTINTGDISNIPNQTLGSPSYSLMENPFGLPGGLGNSRLIGMSQINTSITVTAPVSTTAVPGLSVTVTVPANRKVLVTLFGGIGISNTVSAVTGFAICAGTASDANRLAQANNTTNSSGADYTVTYIDNSTGSRTYVAALNSASGNATVGGNTVSPAYITAQLI